MKCPVCAPNRYPDWPALRQAGIEDWLKCPVCKTLFYRDGRKIKDEDGEGKPLKGLERQEKLIRDFLEEVSRKKNLPGK